VDYAVEFLAAYPRFIFDRSPNQGKPAAEEEIEVNSDFTT
jgi:hypothetical protein